MIKPLIFALCVVFPIGDLSAQQKPVRQPSPGHTQGTDMAGAGARRPASSGARGYIDGNGIADRRQAVDFGGPRIATYDDGLRSECIWACYEFYCSPLSGEIARAFKLDRFDLIPA